MTAQVPERLIYEGEELPLTFCPPLPEQDPRLQERNDDELKECDPIVFSTACWRRYIATWEIKDGRFYLANVMGRYKLVSDTPLFAHWFSGVLRVPKGKLLQYVHMGFATVYEQELHIKIENGVVVETTVVDNRGRNAPPSAQEWGDIF